MSTSSLQIERVYQVSIPVQEISQAVTFYNETLELPLLFQQSNMAILLCGGMQLLLSVPESPEFDHPSSTVYFYVPDIEAACSKLDSRGVTFRGKPHKIAEMNGVQTWMVFFNDPDGNTHALTSEVRTGSFD
ncbi:methylmalonyl-CoA epimerase [Paenibacillus cellulosilyticus]|uniref:Methylmalonyl-CoA epimerase n=1 Tax=Paenibacillus cellulosilyticus TaxID=375489 RepID=A0A2V2Z181_9BACL|nr:VOC family protein [Paenibacillus cellulosilyticus]PWW08562.1 methylmalonyl-CoA epimerase [Paenibacillus cellulosilyticus]QKS48134.1 VOC family protein [Paenibacillus cellulosilyticus]